MFKKLIKKPFERTRVYGNIKNNPPKQETLWSATDNTRQVIKA